MEHLKCWAVSTEKLHDDVFLPDGEAVNIGRSPDTKIKEIKCSRKQVELKANYAEKKVIFKQLGLNTGFVDGKELNQNETTELVHGKCFSLLENQFNYSIRFEPPDQPSCSAAKASGNKNKLENSEDNPVKTKKFKASDHDSDNEQKKINDVESKLEEMRKNMVNSSSSLPPKAEPVKMEVSSEPEGKSSWKVTDSILVYIPKGLVHRNKIASFDIDGTIITTKSGKVFPINYHDWRILYPEIQKKVKDLFNTGYKIVFMTNQKGISKGKTGVKEFQGKVEAILKRFEVPIQVFVSTGIGMYRKPTPGMWTHLETEENGGVTVDRATSFYVGDAAGRPVGWAHAKKKDFSNNDRLFALNLKVDFHTPEEFFLGQKKATFNLPAFDPRAVLSTQTTLCEPSDVALSKNTCEMILTVGFPASGKSHFVKEKILPNGYVHINRDLLGTWQKCVAACDKALASKKSVVVDNTNPDKDTRTKYLQVAKKHKVPSRCFQFKVGLDQAKHNNRFRELCGTDKAHANVNDMVLNSYKSKFQEPNVSEGFEEIVKINFVPSFKDKRDEELYSLFLLEK